MPGGNTTCLSEVIYMQIVAEFYLQVWATNLSLSTFVNITGSKEEECCPVVICFFHSPNMIMCIFMWFLCISCLSLESIFWCLLYTLKCAALIIVNCRMSAWRGGGVHTFAHPWKSELSKNLRIFRDMCLWHSSSGIIWQLIVCWLLSGSGHFLVLWHKHTHYRMS